jgi:hypothetical protein
MVEFLNQSNHIIKKRYIDKKFWEFLEKHLGEKNINDFKKKSK